MKKLVLLGASTLALAALLSPVVGSDVPPASAATATAAATAAATSTAAKKTTWLSGASGNGVPGGQFGSWRGRSVDIAGSWSDDDANSLQFWQLQKKGVYGSWKKPIDIAVGAFDKGESWKKAAAGAYDARWTASLTKLASLRSQTSATTYIRFAHEMNGNWYPWSVNTGNYKDFDTAWKRYRAIQKKVFPKAKLVFNLNKETIGAGMDWRKFFPGKSYVDVVSVDYYNSYPYVSTSAQWWSSMHQKDAWGAPWGLAEYVTYAKSQGLPLAISEWAGHADKGDSPVFVQKMLQYVKTYGGTGSGEIAYEILFNQAGYDNDFALWGSGSSMPKSSAAYRAFFK